MIAVHLKSLLNRTPLERVYVQDPRNPEKVIPIVGVISRSGKTILITPEARADRLDDY